MPINFKGLLVRALAVLTFVSIIGIAVAFRKDDHAYEIKLLQNTSIGEGFAGQRAGQPRLRGGQSVMLPRSERQIETSSQDLMAVGYTLMSAKNPAVRAQSADTFGKVAAAENRGSVEYGPREAQMIDLMQAAYHSEKDERVRCHIVASAQSFNHPQAEELITAGLKDESSAVRQAASQAKQARDKRLVLAGSGDIPMRIWR